MILVYFFEAVFFFFYHFHQMSSFGSSIFLSLIQILPQTRYFKSLTYIQNISVYSKSQNHRKVQVRRVHPLLWANYCEVSLFSQKIIHFLYLVGMKKLMYVLQLVLPLYIKDFYLLQVLNDCDQPCSSMLNEPDFFNLFKCNTPITIYYNYQSCSIN